MIGKLLHWINEGVWAIGETGLNVTYGAMKRVNPHVPEPVFWAWSQVILKVADLLNHRVFLDLPLYLLSSAAIWSVGDMSDEAKEGEDTKLFFRLGRDGFGCELGTGHGSCNCFFPNSLAYGPIMVAGDQAPMAEKRNVEIAKSCALLSLLSYRHDKDIIESMQKHGMLPNTSFFSVHTMEECDLSVFVADDQRWAVFCVRGTEPETLRDWCTSVLLKELSPFFAGFNSPGYSAEKDNGETKVRTRYFRQMRKASRKVLKFHTGKLGPTSGEALSAFELAFYLSHRGDCSIYFTGHSLGGGIATLMGADLLAWTEQAPTGIVSFGSPPVGNETFCDWFNQHFNQHSRHVQRRTSVSWRFVLDKEFAPMAPPLPFVAPHIADQFEHVGRLIRADNLLESTATPKRSQSAMEQEMDYLAKQHILSTIILDHNLATTIRNLQKL